MISDFRGNTITVSGAMECLGYAQFATVSAVTAVNLATASPTTGVSYTTLAQNPAKMPRIMVISVDTQAIRYRDDGTAPTTTVGMSLSATTQGFVYQGQIESFQFISATASANVNISYYA